MNWIPVTERLPEYEFCYCLVCFQPMKDLVVVPAKWCDETFYYFDAEDEVNEEIEYVTHWQPLPDPPEEANE